MTQQLRLIRTAAVLVLILPGLGPAVAQGGQQATTVQQGAVVQGDQSPTAGQKGTVVQGELRTAVQPGAVATVGGVSRPGKLGALQGPNGEISVFLTEAECKGLGGTVNTVDTDVCSSGKVCVTADKDGVVRGVCFKK